MSDQMVRKSSALIALILAVALLTGCAGQPLARREIVRAIFFSREQGSHQALLLLQDQSSEQPDAYTTAAGEGTTPAKALADAVSALEGSVFYGSMDTVCLPPDSDWQELQQYARLLTTTAQPAPEIALMLLDTRDAETLQDTAGELYDTIRSKRERYQLFCGLESLSAQPDTAALPSFQPEGYGFVIVSRQGEQIRYTETLRAQLAAVLCGQSRRLETAFDRQQSTCQAGCQLLVQAGPDKVSVQLTLTDARLLALAQDTPQGEEQLRRVLQTELETAFRQLVTDTSPRDPFCLQFWAKCSLGPDAPVLPAELSVTFA